MAIETLFAQADCDVTDAKNNTETLRGFGVAPAVALRNVLYQGG